MYIKCNMCDACDNLLLHITPNDRFEFRYRFEDGLYLILPDKEIVLREVDLFCQGRPNLPESAVGDLFAEMLEVITQLIKEEEISILDIDEIENKLITEKYEKKWISEGYVEVYADGSW